MNDNCRNCGAAHEPGRCSYCLTPSFAALLEPKRRPYIEYDPSGPMPIRLDVVYGWATVMPKPACSIELAAPAKAPLSRGFLRALFALPVACFFTACGGGADNPPDHFLLIMETTTHQPETVFVYDSEHDCISAGSYRLTAFPGKYLGYACKEV